MEGPTLQEFMESHDLSEEDCNQQVSDDHLEVISRSSCKEWKSLPAHLGLPTIVADDIDSSQKEEGKKRHDFFLKWKEMKGSGATYKQLIAALLKIKCAQDAEGVSEVLKKSVALQRMQKMLKQSLSEIAQPLPTPGNTGTDAPDVVSLDPDTLEDLKMQLSSDLTHIMGTYSLYVSSIRETLQEKGVTASDLCADLMTMSAFSHGQQKLVLLSGHKEELEKAADLNGIFNIIAAEYATFIDYEIFRFILEKYQKKYSIDIEQEELKYPEHLKAYLTKHKVSEFIEINPLLKKYAATSTPFVLKMDIESTSTLAKIKKLKTSIAKILGLKSRALRLLDITDGCLVVTFLIPTHVAEAIFDELTPDQEQQFQAELVVRMECNNQPIFDFTPRLSNDNFIQEIQEDMKCGICSAVATDPRQHEVCGTLFCEKCLKKTGKDNFCPHCQTEGHLFSDKRSEKAIQKLGVSCIHMDVGCRWEGTVATWNEHIDACTFKKTTPRKSSRASTSTRCYLFVEDSNLWVTGQKAHGKKLVDADTDSRYRIDLGKFMHLVTEGNIPSKAFLYGSIPPITDSVWKAAKEKNFIVNIFKRSDSGKVKEVHGAMVRDIMKTLNTKVKATFIIASGDRNLRPVITEILENGMLVVLWSWKNAMARVFYELANSHSLFTANYLDSVEEQFSFTACMSNRDKTEVDPAHAIVYRDVPAGDEFKYDLADHMHRLLRLFYMTAVKTKLPEKRDYIIEFPNSDPHDILLEIRRWDKTKTRPFKYQPCSYPEYRTRLKQVDQSSILTTNRFEPLINPDFKSLPDKDMLSCVTTDNDSDYESLPDTSSATPTRTENFQSDWNTEVRRNLGGNAAYMKKTPCKWHDHCQNASQCPFLHTDEEKELFSRFPRIDFRYYRTRECDKKGTEEEHVTVQQRKRCAYAHGDQDSWCLNCKAYGHLTDDCQVS